MTMPAMGRSVAAYEASSEVNKFTSKFNYYLQGLVDLTREEKKGLALFLGKGKCANCHVIGRGSKKEPPLVTDFTYDNLGVPKNPENPFYLTHPSFSDEGLGAFINTRQDYQRFAREGLGKQKVPTLRNVDRRPSPGFVKAYTGNGYFKNPGGSGPLLQHPGCEGQLPQPIYRSQGTCCRLLAGARSY